jgi:hypothetical protein
MPLLGQSSFTASVSCAKRTFENQFFRASGLNLLVAAVILWNTKYLERALATLQAQLQIIPRVTPLGWEHIGLTGDYIWEFQLRSSLACIMSAFVLAPPIG